MNRFERRRAASGRKPSRKGSPGLLPLAIGVAALFLACGAFLLVIGGTTPPDLTIGGRWSLTDPEGLKVTGRDFRGRYVLLYFGYTSCPDVCPTTLNAVADAMHLLGARADRLQPVFVTVDPSHDTPTVVGDYVKLFGARLVGLTGTEAQIATIEKEYRVHSSVMHSASARDAPMIDHTAVLLLIGPDGRYLAPLPPDESGREIARRLRRYIS